MHGRGSTSRIPTCIFLLSFFYSIFLVNEHLASAKDHSEKPLSTNRAKFVNLISTIRKGDEDTIVGSEVLRSLNFALNPV